MMWYTTIQRCHQSHWKTFVSTFFLSSMISSWFSGSLMQRYFGFFSLDVPLLPDAWHYSGRWFLYCPSHPQQVVRFWSRRSLSLLVLSAVVYFPLLSFLPFRYRWFGCWRSCSVACSSTLCIVPWFLRPATDPRNNDDGVGAVASISVTSKHSLKSGGNSYKYPWFVKEQMDGCLTSRNLAWPNLMTTDCQDLMSGDNSECDNWWGDDY